MSKRRLGLLGPIIGCAPTLVGFSTLRDDVVAWGPFFGWLYETKSGRASLIIFAVATTFAFLAGPSLWDRRRKAKIVRLCQKLRAVKHYDTTDFYERANAGGAVVMSLRDCGAFRANDEAEATVDQARKKQLSVQHVGPDQNATPEFQAFFRVAQIIRPRYGHPAHYDLDAEADIRAKENCEIIATYVEEVCKIRAPRSGPIIRSRPPTPRTPDSPT